MVTRINYASSKFIASFSNSDTWLILLVRAGRDGHMRQVWKIYKQIFSHAVYTNGIFKLENCIKRFF